MKSRDQSLSDVRLLMYIQRVNLDMLWSLESFTVEMVLNQYIKARSRPNEMNMDTSIQSWPNGDAIGFGEAIIILRYSLKKGNNASSQYQFNTIRKVRILSTNRH